MHGGNERLRCEDAGDAHHGTVWAGQVASRVRALAKESLTWVLRLTWSLGLLGSQFLSSTK